MTCIFLKTKIGLSILFLVLIFLAGFGGFFYYQTSHLQPVSVRDSAPSVPRVSRENLSKLVSQCNQDDPEACLSVGYIYLRGIIDQDERDFKQAVNYFEKACDGFKDLNRKALQCEAIEKIFENGKEARPDRKFAAIFREKAEAAKLAFLKQSPVSEKEITQEKSQCDDGQVSSCFHLGENYLRPDHLDLNKAEENLMKTCDSGGKHELSRGEEYPGKFCGLVAEIFEYGRQGLSQDLDKAGRTYQKACDIAADSPVQNGFMCDLAGNFFRDKKNNQHLAASLYTKGCRLGLQDSCEHLKKIGAAE